MSTKRVPTKRRRGNGRGRSRPRRTSAGVPTTAIVRVPAARPERPWELTDQQTTLLKNYLHMASATEMEVRAGLEVAKRYKLDPFKQGQIWFIKRWDSNADNGKGGQGAFTWTPQVGIYGMLHIAARDHADYGSLSEPEYGPKITHEVEGHEIKAPEWCRIKAYKKGIAEPTVATIYFEEFCPGKWDNARLFWARMPKAQVAKCARAQAVRLAYPDLGGLYIPEEMDRMKDDYTPEGRQIVRRENENDDIQSLKDRGLWCETHQCPINAKHMQTCKPKDSSTGQHPSSTIADAGTRGHASPASPGAERTEKNTSTPEPSAQAQPQKTLYELEVDWTEPNSPILRGQLSEILPQLQKFLHMEWKNSWWHILPQDVKTLHDMAPTFMLAINEVHKAPADNSPKSVPSAGKSKTREGAASSTTGDTAPVLVKGVIQQANPEQGAKPRVSVLLKIEKASHWMSTFDTKFFPWLINGKGKEAELFIEKRTKGDKTFTNIVGLKRIGTQQFDSDNKPALDVNREAGTTKKLWE